MTLSSKNPASDELKKVKIRRFLTISKGTRKEA